MHTEKIVAIRSIGIRKTLDLEVKSDAHVFYANRIAVSNSHAYSYALMGYLCAYVKYHFPLHFFSAWLSFANSKTKPKVEIAELIQEAKLFDIVVENPNLTKQNRDFTIEDGFIRFGIGSIKSVGYNEVTKLLAAIKSAEVKLSKPVDQFSWYETLLHVLMHSRSDVAQNLIHAGAVSYFGISRSQMLFEYLKLKSLNDKEVSWIQGLPKNESLTADIQSMIDLRKSPANRKVKVADLLNSIVKPSASFEDSIDIIAKCEEDVLGISLSCSKLDNRSAYRNATCIELNKGLKTTNVILTVQIDRVTEWFPKDEPEKKICFLTVHDQTGTIDIMVGTHQYIANGYLLFDGNTVAISGSLNKRGNLSVNKIEQI